MAISLFAKIIGYKLFRRFGFPHMMPINLTVSVTYRCNSKCKTCNIWKKTADELNLGEYEKIFKSIGNAPFWVTISGGEPFLRKDIVEICESLYRNCKPKIINIPSNGILSDLIIDRTKQICEIATKSKIIINLSMDDIGPRHDEIRGVGENYDKASRTYRGLKGLGYKNLTIGIGTVISKFNVAGFAEIYRELIKLNPDSYVTEIAEERVELDTVGADIAPAVEDHSKAIDFLIGEINSRKFKDISKITQAFRIEYYRLVKKILNKKRQAIPCYAGFASCQIAPNGEMWACCINAAIVGNLRDANYDFRKIWFGKQANEVRQHIKTQKCFCPLANAGYTNMLCNFKSLFQILLNLINQLI